MKSRVRGLLSRGRNDLHSRRVQPFARPTQPLLEVDAWDVGAFVTDHLIPVVGVHPFPPHELMLMASAAVWLRPGIIVEWGTHIGKSARVFYETCREYGLDTVIHSIDLSDDVPHVEHPGESRGLLVRDLPVTLHQGDGATIAVQLLRGSDGPSLVFIDGDHEYESVAADARRVWDARPDAAVLFHDTFYQPGSGYNHGPYHAIQTLTAEQPSCQVVSTHLGLPGMTLVVPQS